MNFTHRAFHLAILSLVAGCATEQNRLAGERTNTFPASPKFVWVKVIYRLLPEKDSSTPMATQVFRHSAIVSETLPQGVWEVGPDSKGLIATTHTVKNLSNWPTHKATQQYLASGDEDIVSRPVRVNKQGLLDAIKIYEENFVGLKYSFQKHNENYAVAGVIYGAGGYLPKQGDAPEYPDFPAHGNEYGLDDSGGLMQWRKEGADLSHPHEIHFFLYFSTESSAELAARRVQDRGFQVDVGRQAGGGVWLCHATKTMIPELPQLQKIRHDFDSLAASLNGIYDGWGTKF